MGTKFSRKTNKNSFRGFDLPKDWKDKSRTDRRRWKRAHRWNRARNNPFNFNSMFP